MPLAAKSSGKKTSVIIPMELPRGRPGDARLTTPGVRPFWFFKRNRFIVFPFLFIHVSAGRHGISGLPDRFT